MISKRVPMRHPRRSNVVALIAYLLHNQGREDRVGSVNITNCESDNVAWAAAEILAVQNTNQRSAADKTYHLIIALRPGENPAGEVLREIEKRYAEALGFGEHQRVSVVHHDTDHTHIHVAISKVHPITANVHEPFRDYWTRSKLTARLEAEFGLAPTNHQHRKPPAEGRAADAEHHTGIETLLSYARREAVPALRGAGSWQQLHAAAAGAGLEIRKRGAGLVVVDGDGNAVRASLVAGDLSLGRLEDRLGPWCPAPESSGRPMRQGNPVATGLDTSALYARYQADKAADWAAFRAARSAGREMRDRAIRAARVRNGLRRAAIRHLTTGAPLKRVLYAQAAAAWRADVRAVKRRVRPEAGRGLTWVEWLRQEAVKGDDEAIEALRRRRKISPSPGPGLSGDAPAKTRTTPLTSITKTGTAVLANAVRDDGQRVHVAGNANDAAVSAAIATAAAKYGRSLTVTGPIEFQARVVALAVAGAHAITFTNDAMEKARQTLERDVERARRGPDRASTGLAGGRDSEQRGGGRPGHRGGIGYASGGRATAAEPDLGPIGARPPPEARNGLRDLSALRLVRDPDGTAGLLPGHVPGRLVEQGTEPAHPLRRGGHVWGADLDWRAADAYAAEREAKRQKIADISCYRRYDGAPGALTYGGVRAAGGGHLALLKSADGAVLVMPLSAEAAASCIRRLSVGAAVKVGTDGMIRKARGRAR